MGPNDEIVFNDPAIVGHDLVLQAAGDIGSAQKVMTTNINGALSAVANGDLYLEQVGEDAFAIRQKHDAIKTQYCFDNGITLLRFSYQNSMDDIKTELMKYCV